MTKMQQPRQENRPARATKTRHLTNTEQQRRETQKKKKRNSQNTATRNYTQRNCNYLPKNIIFRTVYCSRVCSGTMLPVDFETNLTGSWSSEVS